MKQSETIELRDWPWPVDVMFYPSEVEPGWWVIKVSSEIRDSRTGKHGVFGKDMLVSRRPRGKKLARYVRDLIVEHLAHEVEEHLTINGVLVLDPHELTPKAKRNKRTTKGA